MDRFIGWHFSLILLVLLGLLLMAPLGHAQDFVVTAKPSRVECSNGNQLLLEPLQIVQLSEKIDRETYRVKLSTRFSKLCPDGTLSAFDVYNVGDLASPKSRNETGPSETVVTDNNLEPAIKVERRRSPLRVEREGKGERRSRNGLVLNSSVTANDFFDSITKNMAKACRQNFLGKEGFGAWGNHIVDTLSIGYFEDVLDRDRGAFRRLCPAYRSMNVEQKKNLLVLILMAQANWESSCRPNAINRSCPNGTCYGILQLHLGRERSYVRGAEFKPYCPVKASKSAKQSLSCGLAMLMEDLDDGEKIVGNSNSHWEVFRPALRGSKVEKFTALIDKIPDCHQAQSQPLMAARQNRGNSQFSDRRSLAPHRPLVEDRALSDAFNSVPVGSL